MIEKTFFNLLFTSVCWKQVGNGNQVAKMIGDKDILYSCNGTHRPASDHPKLGDIRIIYTYIPQDTYTIAAKWRQDPDPEGTLTAYKDALKEHELRNITEIILFPFDSIFYILLYIYLNEPFIL